MDHGVVAMLTHITNCKFCGTCYEEISEEAANHPGRMCRQCAGRILSPTWRCRKCGGKLVMSSLRKILYCKRCKLIQDPQ